MKSSSSGFRGQHWFFHSFLSSSLLLVFYPSWEAAAPPPPPPPPPCLLLGLSFPLQMLYDSNICHLEIDVFFVFIFQELCFPEALCQVWWQKSDVLWQWKGEGELELHVGGCLWESGLNWALIVWFTCGPSGRLPQRSDPISCHSDGPASQRQ